MAVFLDFKKAYDRVNPSYLWGCMENIGIPMGWIHFLSALQGTATSQVMVNNHLTSDIRLSRGVRQGCPLSSLLFVIAVEPLACLTSSSRHINGLKLNEHHTAVKMLLYADDVTLILRDDADLIEAERLTALYEVGSGAKLNSGKCELLHATKSPQTLPSDCRFDIKPVEYVTTLLGAPVGCLIKDKVCWEGILDRVDARLAKWKARSMSIAGRTVALTITYLLHVQMMPAGLKNQLEARFC